MTTPAVPTRLQPAVPKKRRISVSAILAISFGILIFFSVGSVLALSVGANYRNTVDLLGARAGLLIDAMEDQLRGHMTRAEKAVDGLAHLYDEGGFDIDDSGRMTAALSGALEAVPEATGMLIFEDDLTHRGVVRGDSEHNRPDALQVIKPEPEKSADVIAAIKARAQVEGLQWGSFVANEFGLFANVSMPLARNGIRQGFVVAPVELRTLSSFTEDLSRRFGTTAFILDGDNKVLAHPILADANASKAKPLEPLASFSDPVLAKFSSRQPFELFEEDPVANVEVSEIRVETPDGPRSYVAMTRKIAGYSDQLWMIGAYFESRELSAELRRATLSGLIGLGALGAAIIAAILLGKRLSRPVQAIAGHARQVADFDLDNIQPLPRSRVRELDDQASAFNAMLIGLRAFSTYIPRSLVAKLVRSGEVGIAEPREALVTVMFTDIASFTTLSERMDASETTKLLNHHFAILCRAVDQHGGTVDKFLGDGMMAFFGAPDRLERHAECAVLAAIQIRDELAADNARAKQEGREPLVVRIGIHTGPVTVGNIGASDRVNYTIIGDTVNVSQRLQGLGKTVAAGQETSIVISSETASELDAGFELISAGEHFLRGRDEPTEVFLVKGRRPYAIQQRKLAG
ncbi:MAG: adenylate/guanylate cyclase domain-containing protein [Rhizobiaceae bacterium]